MLRAAFLLAFAGVIGVVAATSSTCAIGLLRGTDTWCGFEFAWPVGFMFAVPVAVVLGLPAEAFYRCLGLRHWLWYLAGGMVLALPVWLQLATPFDSPRWNQVGFFDSMNYLGTGAIAGLVFWLLQRRGGNAP